ncbi:hypothetical protein D3C86_1977820 [compost metagenome]
MRLRRKVDHHINTLAEQRIHRLYISNISLGKSIIRMILNRLQILQIACVRQSIYVDDFVFRVLLQHVNYKIAADEAGSAGN